ncbi:MAG: FtsX-like permease family protein [Candidatus Bathyarchaeota archaeon]|nr:FtsX-like permease family protein [Candidatus Bathyarchaeota archaeon]MDH5635676.1 FtsX-like permease family protein [Candidatus Bathyarchaeota archaeon]MDH5702214.1 FtsX-like permease family protein [Candidatus Bathyarchaeota archaeon]
MSEISFPIKDLTRRKFQTGLTILGLTICTSATLFLVIFGSNLGFEIAFLTVGGRLTSGFSNIFSRFILVVGFLNILAGAFITSFLVYLTMSERVRDIGVMKAAGCVSGSILGYFVTELSILVFLSCIAGTIFGIGAYYLSISLLNVLGFSISQVLSLWAILLIFLVLILVSHIFGVLPIIKAAKVKPAEALSPLYSLGTTFELGRAVPSKLGFTFKVAYRSLVRRKSATGQAIICLALVLTLTTVTIAGGMIANKTTTNYVERAIGRDVVLVGHPKLIERYVNLLSQFFEAKEMESIDYLDSRYSISNSRVSELSNISGVLMTDPRLVLGTIVYEVQGVIIDPERPDPYILVGDNRSAEALVVGVQPERVINEWLIFGRVLNETDVHSAVIGDSLALEMFDDPQKQAIRVFEKNFEIPGVCLDPLNNGKVVYVPLNALSAELGQLGYNLLFLKIDPSERSRVLTEIENEISGKNLELVELNEVLGRHVSFLNHIWSFVMFLPLFSLVTATLCLLSYLMLSIAGQQREFGIMRALGAKPRSIMKIIFTQALLITLISGAIGISVGLFVTFVFLIPEPVVSQYTLVSVAGWLLFALGLLCSSSLYPAMKAVKKSVVGAIYSV